MQSRCFINFRNQGGSLNTKFDNGGRFAMVPPPKTVAWAKATCANLWPLHRRIERAATDWLRDASTAWLHDRANMGPARVRGPA